MPNINDYKLHFKNIRALNRAHYLHPICKEIMIAMIEWFKWKDHDFIITETVTTEREDEALNRVSSTHRQGRAFDGRTRGLPEDLIKECIRDFEEVYGHWGAVSYRTKKRNLIVWHNSGHGDHLHIQIDAKFALDIDVES